MRLRPVAIALLLSFPLVSVRTHASAPSEPPAPASASRSPAAPAAPDQDGGASHEYRLFPQDVIKVTVLGESDLSVERRIDALGRVNLPLLGTVNLKNMRPTEAEDKVRQLYISGEILVRPNISITVSEYAPREISVLGQVQKPGNLTLPIETETITIVEAISRAGGFTRIPKDKEVQVTRHPPDGSADQSFTVNVKEMIDGTKHVEPFMILPGDVIFVPESIF